MFQIQNAIYIDFNIKDDWTCQQMLNFALNRFNQSLITKNAFYTLNDDAETLADNYYLRAAKKNGMIDP